jgi:hypothetical protein
MFGVVSQVVEPFCSSTTKINLKSNKIKMGNNFSFEFFIHFQSFEPIIFEYVLYAKSHAKIWGMSCERHRFFPWEEGTQLGWDQSGTSGEGRAMTD